MAKSKYSAGVVLLVLLFIAFGATAAHAEVGKRFALVIGNSAYEHVEPLRNPANDASDMADELEALGFTVFRGVDHDRDALARLLTDFRTAAADAEAVVFYYAGHGFQLDGRNHLVPVDAVLSDRSRIREETFLLDEVIRSIHSWDRQTIVFLDACRNNPLPPSLQERTTQGLAEMQVDHGVFVAFATKPGKVTWDGRGRNSPFTRALLTHIWRAGQSISELMINVRNEVLTETLGAQMPSDQSSLREQFYFNTSLAPAVTRAPSVPTAGLIIRPVPQAPISGEIGSAAETDPEEEEQFWLRVAESEAMADLQSYLQAYPNGRFVPRAYERLAAIARAEAETSRARQEEEEKALWGQLAASGTIADLRSYLESYPEGQFVGEARQRLAALEAAETARLAEEEEKALWGRVMESGTIADLEAYVESYPEGRFVSEARRRLAALEAAEIEPGGEEETLRERELVMALQRVVQKLGCYSGRIDGVWGANSRLGMERLLQYSKIKASPSPSQELWTKTKAITSKDPICTEPARPRIAKPSQPKKSHHAVARPRKPASAAPPAASSPPASPPVHVLP